MNTIAPIALTRMTEGLMPPQIAKYLKPDLISPLVAYLCSEACTANGEILSVGGGRMARVQFFTADGVQFNPETEVTPDMVAASFGQISDMGRAKFYQKTGEEIEQRLKEMGVIK
jgi:hypothetical protein